MAASSLDRKKQRKEEHRRRVDVILADTPCQCCGYHGVAKQFHHRDRSEKQYEISRLLSTNSSWRQIEQEIAKCDVLCANCHQEVEHAIRHGYRKTCSSGSIYDPPIVVVPNAFRRS